MNSYWVIYTYTDRLSSYMAKQFIGDYQEVEDEINSWCDYCDKNNMKIIDIAQSLEEDDDEDNEAWGED